MACPVVNCNVPGWGFSLIAYLKEQIEVDLINCDFSTFAGLCEGIAIRFSMRVDIDRTAQSVRFRKRLDATAL